MVASFIVTINRIAAGMLKLEYEIKKAQNIYTGFNCSVISII